MQAYPKPITILTKHAKYIKLATCPWSIAWRSLNPAKWCRATDRLAVSQRRRRHPPRTSLVSSYRLAVHSASWSATPIAWKILVYGSKTMSKHQIMQHIHPNTSVQIHIPQFNSIAQPHILYLNYIFIYICIHNWDYDNTWI